MKKIWIMAIALALMSMIGTACYEPPITRPTRVIYVYVPEYRWNMCFNPYIYQPCYMPYYGPNFRRPHGPVRPAVPPVRREQIPMKKPK